MFNSPGSVPSTLNILLIQYFESKQLKYIFIRLSLTLFKSRSFDLLLSILYGLSIYTLSMVPYIRGISFPQQFRMF